jgi:hypothetical protein
MLCNFPVWQARGGQPLLIRAAARAKKISDPERTAERTSCMPLQSNGTRSKFGLASVGGGLLLFVACGGSPGEADDSRRSVALMSTACVTNSARVVDCSSASGAGSNTHGGTPASTYGTPASTYGGTPASSYGGTPTTSYGGSVSSGGATASGGSSSEPGDGLAGSMSLGGGSGEEDPKPVETKAINAIVQCLKDKQAKQKAPLSVADAIDCFPKECTYELVMSVKSLHNSCYTAKGCELPRVLVHCGEGTGSSIGSFNLCPTRSNRVKDFTHHFEISEDVGTKDKTRIFAFSQALFPWKEQEVLITDDKKFTCFGGTCHSFSDKPTIANKGVPFLDHVPEYFPEKQKDIEAVCKCMTDEAFTEIKYRMDGEGVAVEKDDVELARKMCGLFKDRFKQRPPREPKKENEGEDDAELEAMTEFLSRIRVDSAP